MNKPVFVISCPFDTYSGYGARARDIAKAIINTDKYEVKLMAQRWGSTSWGFCKDHPEWEFLYNHKLPDNKLTSKPDIWMQITIPNEFQPVGNYNIGCTAGIEATICKPEWIEGLNRMNMNWVSSTFSKKVFENTKYDRKDKNTGQIQSQIKLEKPIEVVFEGANLDIYKNITSKEIKTLDLSNINESFCYLFVGHWMQGNFGHDRKNIWKTVKVFFEVFKNQKQKPALILKSSIGVSSYVSRDEILNRISKIKKTVNSSDLPNVYVLSGELSDQEVNELYNHPKVKSMVSFTKGEGFGRPLLEFSLTGKPIIASNWSGHTDFLKSNFSTLINGDLENVDESASNDWLIKEAQWFKPHDSEMGRSLKDVYKKYKQFIVKSKQQKNFSKTRFSFEKMQELIGNILTTNIPEFPKQIKLSLPKLKKIE